MLSYLSVEEQRRQEQTAVCSTLTNNTISDCNVTNTNSAAAIVIRSVPEHTYTCSPATCGGDRCPNPQRRSLDNSTLDLLSKRGDTADGDWPDPSDYDDEMEDFIRSEIIEASSGGSPFAEIVGLSTERETTTSKHITFEDNFRSVTVAGLWGCTSIIVVSRRGAWASHIWQNAFEDDGPFQEMAIQKVHRGDGTDDHAFGIDELMNKANEGRRGVIFGDETNPEDDPKVKVIIVTPRPHAPMVEENSKGKPVFTSDVVRENPHANFDKPPIYLGRLEEVKSNLERTFPNVPIVTMTYAPRVETNEESGDLQDLMTFGEKEKLEAKREEVKKRLADPEIKTARGKVLLQYRPGHVCHKAGWRIFLEESGVQEDDQWNPSPTQVFTRPAPG